MWISFWNRFFLNISKLQDDFEKKYVALICVSMSFIKVIVIVIVILIVIVMGDAVLVRCQFMFITMHAFISQTCLFLIHHQHFSSHPAPWWCAELRAGQPKSEALSLDEPGKRFASLASGQRRPRLGKSFARLQSQLNRLHW